MASGRIGDADAETLDIGTTDGVVSWTDGGVATNETVGMGPDKVGFLKGGNDGVLKVLVDMDRIPREP